MKKENIIIICSTLLLTCLLTCTLISFRQLHFLNNYIAEQTTTLQSLTETTHKINTDLLELSTTLSSSQDEVQYYQALIALQSPNNASTLPYINTTLVPNLESLLDDMGDSDYMEHLVSYYIDKLKDQNFTSTYNEGYIWYTAAESLGEIGKPAIPSLINNLCTTDDYERTLTLYALLLASQADNVKEFTNGDYIHTTLDFDPSTHSEQIKVAKIWWDTYKDYF